MKRERVGWSLICSKYFLLFPLCLFIYSCQTKTERLFSPVIIDTVVLNKKHRKFFPSNCDFQTLPIYYIGNNVDSIILPNRPIASYIPKPMIKRPDGTFSIDNIRNKYLIAKVLNDRTRNSDSLNLYVDTNKIILRESYYDLENYIIAIEHYPLFIYNLSKKDTLFLPQKSSWSAQITTVDKKINLTRAQSCGMYGQCLFLPPRQMLMGLIAKSYGDSILETQIMINGISSNHFNLSINKKTLDNYIHQFL